MKLLRIIKLVGILLLNFYFLGCIAPVQYKQHPQIKIKPSEMVELNSLAKQRKLDYSYNTIDDIIEISSTVGKMKLLLKSPLILFNGQFFSISQPPIYKYGKIYVPSEIFSFSLPKHYTNIPFSSLKIHTIVIDPGHGGKDPGAISPWGIKEKDLNLAVAKYLKQELIKRGYKVLLTRQTDVFLTLKQRVQFAKENQADFFISIHANANRSRKARGIEVYYLSDRQIDTETKAVLLAENNALQFNNKEYLTDTTEKIIWDLICVENNNQSLEFAALLLKTFSSLGLNIHYSSPKGAPFYVLKYACTSSVLVEMGYLTNRKEASLLKSSYYQKQIAHAIALTIDLLNKRYASIKQK